MIWTNTDTSYPDKSEEIIVWDDIIDGLAIAKWDANDWINPETSTIVEFNWYIPNPGRPYEQDWSIHY